MTMRAIWKGRIHFGKYDIPVKLHTAVREQRIQFRLLHSNDQTRLTQQMVCAYEHIPVPREEQVRGFELEDGKYRYCRRSRNSRDRARGEPDDRGP